MLNVIENVRSRTRRQTLKRWLIHMDNARPHNSGQTQKCIEASRAEPLSHPVYSPDLAPTDFFLFRYIKGKLSDYNCENREDLLNGITAILTGVDEEVPLSVFDSCTKRLKS
jgi:histone-lysine N-methyltransferase SETMAR